MNGAIQVGTNVELWQLISGGISLLFGMAGIMFALGKQLISQFRNHVDEKFDDQEIARSEAASHWDKRFTALDATTRKLEGDFRRFETVLPDEYQRRKDAMIQVGRIAALEERTNGLPTHQTVAELHEKMNGIAGEVKELKGEFKATNRTLELIHETLMERK